ncbi:hypothetical protein ACWDV4_01420 [Micromonospora sp. NPDC003197]
MSGKETILSADVAAAGVAKIDKAAEACRQTLFGQVADIRIASSSSTWGNDEAGQAFGEKYAAAPLALEAAEKLTRLVWEMGLSLKSGLSETVNDDVTTAALVKAVPVNDVPDLKF